MHPALPLYCEAQTARYIAEQERNGIQFNSNKAGFLILKLSEEINEVDREAIPQLPKMMNKKGDSYKKPFLKSGKLAKWPALYCEEVGLDPDAIGGSFSKVWYTDFDMGKTDLVKRQLMYHGWKPDEWNEKDMNKGSHERAKRLEITPELAHVQLVDDYIQKRIKEEKCKPLVNLLLKEMKYKGPRLLSSLRSFMISKRKLPTSPKITESSLDTVAGTVGSLVKTRVQLSHRRSLLKGLLKHVDSRGRVRQGANPCATPTFRMKHRVTVNIPAPRSVYGGPIRGLFTGYKDHTLTARAVEYTDDKGRLHRNYIPAGYEDHVGADAAGLEARMLAHYINDSDYIELILNGDVHTFNMGLFGVTDRDLAKTILYALIYGSGDTNLGSLVGGGKKEGARIKAGFKEGLPAYAELDERIKEEAESGYLIGLDGRRITMRRGYDGQVQTHKALNTLLQAAGAIACKYWMIFMHHHIQQQQLTCKQLSHTHDEFMFSSHPSQSQVLMQVMSQSIVQAGEFLNLNIPLASTPMIGYSWLDTH